jgi:hypothetical protein
MERKNTNYSFKHLRWHGIGAASAGTNAKLKLKLKNNEQLLIAYCLRNRR